MKHIALVGVVLTLAACGGNTDAADVLVSTTSIEPTTTVPSGQAKIDEIVVKCDVPMTAIFGDELVLDMSPGLMIGNPPERTWDEHTDYLWAATCIRNDVLGAAVLAILQTASGSTGPQTATQDGLVFTQIYNKLSDTEILTVQVAA